MSSNRFMGKEDLRAGLPSRVAYTLLLIVGVSLLGFAVGCGGSSGPSVPITGNFSNSSLSGSYVYNLYGIDTTGNQYTEAGVFTADGNGNITSGVDDFNQFGSNAVAPPNPITGRYTIGKDGNGTILFTLTNATAPNNTFQVAITMVSTSQLYLTEADTFANASGEANKQTTSAFASPGGTFVFRIHNASSIGSTSQVGAMTYTSGNVTGTVDELRSGAFSPNATLSGTTTAPDSTGRGTLTFTDSLNVTSNYIYYEINSTTYELIESDANTLGQGRMEQQSGSLAFSGNYVFGSKGDTNSPLALLNVRSAGGLTSDGTSTITGGSYDSVQNGSQIVNQPFGGSFTKAPNGRVQLTLTPSGSSPISEIVWMVNSGRAFFLVNDPAKEEDGTMDQQQNMSFANGSLSGQYAFGNDGFFFQSSFPFLTRVGTFIPDGNGNVKLNETTNSFDISQGGSVGSVVVVGTYTVGAPGRATVTLAGSQGNIDLVLYMLSPSAAYVIENDGGTEIGGKMAIQVSP